MDDDEMQPELTLCHLMPKGRLFGPHLHFLFPSYLRFSDNESLKLQNDASTSGADGTHHRLPGQVR